MDGFTWPFSQLHPKSASFSQSNYSDTVVCPAAVDLLLLCLQGCYSLSGFVGMAALGRVFWIWLLLFSPALVSLPVTVPPACLPAIPSHCHLAGLFAPLLPILFALAGDWSGASASILRPTTHSPIHPSEWVVGNESHTFDLHTLCLYFLQKIL